MRHDGDSCQRVMDPDTSEKRIFHYFQQELPNRYFAVVRMEWRDDDHKIVQVDEVKLIDEGVDTIEGFAEVARNAMLGGAEILMICPYDPEHIGLNEQ
tara:strand:+ start:637 stop:930 length:294 start_codon:yes stop_codon:yes gene_type:complete